MVNFSFYKALECLHGAKRDVINQSPPARDWAEIMLDEGLRACSLHNRLSIQQVGANEDSLSV